MENPLNFDGIYQEKWWDFPAGDLLGYQRVHQIMNGFLHQPWVV